MTNHVCLCHLCDSVIGFLMGGKKIKILDEQLICFCSVSCVSDLLHRNETASLIQAPS